MVGQNISRYRIVRMLGQGGMGVVYLAEDRSLGRMAALKFLPPEDAMRDRARRRLLREARAAAALEHPNITAVYEVGEEDGHVFIAMAYAEGETVEELVKKGPVSLARAVDVALQVARGLEAAHSRGVIHRDVKPGNVMVDSTGHVKLMDFGLASASFHHDVSSSEGFRGTPAYMSPEQLSGDEVDERTDVWSLGATLHEMICGKPPFAGDNAPALGYAILHGDPEPLPDSTPADLRRIIDKALEKEPAKRYDGVQEMRAALEAVRERMSGLTAARDGLPRGAVWALVAVAVLAIGLASWRIVSANRSGEPRLLAATPLTSFEGSEERTAFSPDGERIAFSWTTEGAEGYDLYLMSAGGANPLQLTDDPLPDRSPEFAPDGRFIAFLRNQPDNTSEVRLVHPLGGAERLLDRVSVPSGSGLAWFADGTALAVPDLDASGRPILSRVPIAVGEKSTFLDPGPGYSAVLDPEFSPDGSTLAFHASTGLALSDVYLADADGTNVRRLTAIGGQPEGLTWMPDGQSVVFARSSPEVRRSLWIVGIDGGEPRRLAAGDDPTEPVVSRQGLLAFTKRTSNYDLRRVTLDTPGARPRRFLSSTLFDGNPQFSPDGRLISFSSGRGGGTDTWVAEADGSFPRRLTNDGLAGSPRWSPDGRRIALDSTTGGHADIYVVDADGGPLRAVTATEFEDVVPGWSADGEWVLFSSARSGRMEIWRTPVAGGEAVQVSSGGGFYPFADPSGEWIYHAAARDRPTSILRTPFEGGPSEVVIPEFAGGWGNWSIVSGKLYFIDADEELPDAWVIRRADLDGSAIEVVARLTQRPTLGGPGLGIAPDGTEAVYGTLAVDSDLMVVRDFPNR